MSRIKSDRHRHSLEMNDEAAYCGEKSCRIARALALLGNATEDDIAEALGVDLSTLHSWKVTHPEFAEALKAPPSFSDAAVARSLLKCALGYSYTTEKFIYTREGGAVRSVKRYYLPNVEALEFLLQAHMPRLYRQRPKPAKNPIPEWMKSTFRDPKPDAKITQAERLLDDEICRVANVMGRLWASDDETAAALNISLSDFNELRNSHPELAEAIKSGKEMTNSALERALTLRVFGYEYSEDEVFCSREGDVVRTPIRKRALSDAKAQEIWSRGEEARSSSS
jgi:hypothetical protein